jgi:hypothetical protein
MRTDRFALADLGQQDRLDEIVTDADEMHRLYARDFGIDTTYIAYGANIETSTDAGILAQYGLEPKSIDSRQQRGFDRRGFLPNGLAPRSGDCRERGLQRQYG